MPLAAGTKLDSYEILGLLGAGGMGEVYRARDVVLKRDVAIKILPSFVSRDSDRLHRFEQEAQATAALNHPNILAVHRFGVFEGVPYLVSELLEGGTLRQVLQSGLLPVRKTIDYAVQIAHGLATAHEQGIVHRDLKPENLFITKDGRIKILDFGLAKLMQPQPEPDGNAPTMRPGTDPGMVMGTAGYMSPEQVRGKAVDHRTDIFAFGAILYEMLTGTRAFHRSTSAETMTAILNDDPPSISQLAPSIPPGLQRVVHRCLEKNPEQRFHSASDLAFALEALSESGIVPAVATKGFPSQRRRSRALIWSGGVIALLTLADAAYFVVASRNSVPPLRVSAYSQITHDGHAKQLRGTDGSRLYFDQGQLLLIGQVAISGGEIAPVPVTVSGPQLVDVSPDGSTFLVASFTGGLQKAYPLWSVRILGGSVRHLAEAVDAAWSPDGSTVAYSTGEGDIHLIQSDGAEDRRLASVGSLVTSICWSPDGKTIRFTKDQALWEMSSSGSDLHRVLPAWSAGQDYGQWAQDGRFFFVSRGQIWMIDERHLLFRRSSDQPVQMTSGPIRWDSPIPGKDGKTIFASGVTPRGELIRFDAQSRQFQSFLAGISAEFVSFSRDGKSVAYVSYPDGILWRANEDGSSPIQLTNGTIYPRLPNWSPDGTQIVFVATPPHGGNTRAYIVSSQGGTPRLLLPEEAGPETDANWSPDGPIAFSTSGEGGNDPKSVICILELGSNHVTTLPGSVGMFAPRWSPDGRSIVTLKPKSLGLTIFDIRTQRWSTPYKGFAGFPTWSRDSHSIYVLRFQDNPGLLRIPASGGNAERIADLKGVHTTGFYSVWLGLDPTDAPLLLRDVGTSDVYALALEQK
ncbi:protein kinase domain-containing protein [Tunturiibacter lichenicola]|uniref:serine/threonine protein kinase n=1 Tax=Tunturiibacter lichenicola TaxID=2051959 RepID=UPI003D9B462F